MKKAIDKMQGIACTWRSSSPAKVHCIYHKLLYILRTSVCHGNPILDDIDEITRECLSKVLNLPFSDDNCASSESTGQGWWLGCWYRSLRWHHLHESAISLARSLQWSWTQHGLHSYTQCTSSNFNRKHLRWNNGLMQPRLLIQSVLPAIFRRIGRSPE